MKTSLFESICRTHAAAEMAMLEAQIYRFPRRSVVQVSHGRYNAPGIVVTEDGTPTGQLAIQLENGNVWRYPAGCCQPIANRKTWPLWAKRTITKWNRIHRSNMDAITTPSGALKL